MDQEQIEQIVVEGDLVARLYMEHHEDWHNFLHEYEATWIRHDAIAFERVETACLFRLRFEEADVSESHFEAFRARRNAMRDALVRRQVVSWASSFDA